VAVSSQNITSIWLLSNKNNATNFTVSIEINTSIQYKLIYYKKYIKAMNTKPPSPRRSSFFGDKSGAWKDVISPVATSLGCDPMLMRQCIAGHIYLSWTKPLYASHVTVPNVKTRSAYKLDKDWEDKKGFYEHLSNLLGPIPFERYKDLHKEHEDKAKRIDLWLGMAEDDLKDFLGIPKVPVYGEKKAVPDLFHLFTHYPELSKKVEVLENLDILNHFNLTKVLADWNRKQRNPSPVKAKKDAGVIAKKMECVVDNEVGVKGTTLFDFLEKEVEMTTCDEDVGRKGKEEEVQVEVEKDEKVTEEVFPFVCIEENVTVAVSDMEVGRKEKEEFVGFESEEKVEVDDDIILVFPFKGTFEMFFNISKDLVECGGHISINNPDSIFPNEIEEYDERKETRSTRRGSVSISKDVLKRLEPGNWLNSDLLDFWGEW